MSRVGTKLQEIHDTVTWGKKAFSAAGFSALCITTGWGEECGEIYNQRKNQATTYFRNFYTEPTDKGFYEAVVS